MSRIFVKPKFPLVPKPGGFLDQAGEWVDPSAPWVIARLAERDVVIYDPPPQQQKRQAAPPAEQKRQQPAPAGRAAPRRSPPVTRPAPSAEQPAPQSFPRLTIP